MLPCACVGACVWVVVCVRVGARARVCVWCVSVGACECACAGACVWVRVWIRVWVGVCVRVWARVWMRACVCVWVGARVCV